MSRTVNVVGSTLARRGGAFFDDLVPVFMTDIMTDITRLRKPRLP